MNYKSQIWPQSFKREIINELYELKIEHRTLQVNCSALAIIEFHYRSQMLILNYD